MNNNDEKGKAAKPRHDSQNRPKHRANIKFGECISLSGLMVILGFRPSGGLASFGGKGITAKMGVVCK